MGFGVGVQLVQFVVEDLHVLFADPVVLFDRVQFSPDEEVLHREPVQGGGRRDHRRLPREGKIGVEVLNYSLILIIYLFVFFSSSHFFLVYLVQVRYPVVVYVQTQYVREPQQHARRYALYRLLLRYEVPPRVRCRIHLNLTLENERPVLCHYHLSQVHVNDTRPLDKAAELARRELFFKEVVTPSQFEGVWKNAFVPLFLELRIPFKQTRDEFVLDLQDFGFSYRFDGGLGLLPVDEVVRVEHIANAPDKITVFKLFLYCS